MPLTKLGRKVLRRYRAEYGWDHGEEFFYRSIKAGRPGSEKWHTGGKKKMPKKKTRKRAKYIYRKAGRLRGHVVYRRHRRARARKR